MKQFKSESKRLLDLMINSIYTNKEIFLRELISNASDAIDKLYYISLSDENIKFDRENFYIRIALDKFARKIVITDTGIGMTEEELEKNLGTIAKSGSFAFKNENEKKDDVDIIGQFGVGFYSAFMVADKITVESKAFSESQGFKWESNGPEGYTVEPCDKIDTGTVITLHIKPNTDEENYDEFLEEYTIKSLIKKYSDYIKYPIKMLVSHKTPKEGKEGEFDVTYEDETLNSMVPIWRKSKSEVTDEEYGDFYKSKFHDFENPLKTIRTTAEGTASYTALMFVPKRAPYDYYTKEFEKGLALYSNGVMIMEKCGDLLPDYFSFVKGLVDSADLSLNISRELLQHDRQLKIIASRLEKKIKDELLLMQKNDRENYEEFYKSFARQLKFGVYNDFGMHKDVLVDLLMFASSYENKFTTLKEYVERMKEDQTVIYYATGESADKIARLPQAESVLEKGFEILYLTEDIDEFALKVLAKYEEKEFKSIASSDLDVRSDEEKESEKKTNEDNKDLVDFVAKALEGKVAKVSLTGKLKSHPVCITNEGELSVEMEKVLNQMPDSQGIKAQKVLEINMNHPVFEKLKNLFSEDKGKAEKLAQVLYGGALLIEGLTLENPVDFANDICDLLK